MSVINTNITSLIGQSNLTKSQSALQTSMQRLSSGLRINSAKDDAAGQAIANRMTSQITGLQQAQRNANDGISAAQTAEGALNQINDNLQRVRELSVQAQNGTNSQEDLDSIQNEIGQRLNEINRISEETSFNGTKVLASDQTLTIQVGANDSETISISLSKIDVSTLDLTGFNVNDSGETPNTAATKDALTLAGAVQQGSTNEYVLSTDNDLASVLDVLGQASSGDSLVIGTTTYTKQADGSYSYGASYTTDPVDALASAMQPALGEVTTATVTIGGKETGISIASDGSITATASGNVLYLDNTGNLTENGAGSPPAATIDNLAASLASTNGNSIAIDGGATYTAGATAVSTDSADAVVNNATIIANLTAEAGGNATGQAAELSITINGTTSTAFLRQDGTLHTTNDTTTSAALYFDSTGNLTLDSAGNVAATATNLVDTVGARSGSVTIVNDGTGGANANVGEVYTGHGRQVTAAGLETTASGVYDALKAAANADYTLTMNIVDAAGQTDTQKIDFTVAAGAVTTIEFGAFTDAGNGQGSALGAANDKVRLGATGGNLTGDLTTDVSYFVQDNGNVTNNSGQRIYQDAEGDFTTDEATVGDRTADPLGALDNALKMVDSLRSDLGAIQNRFDSAITNLSTTATNLSAARSRIQDADYAVEVANMTRAQILQQAGTSVLAQANQIPQGVLSLLR